jgi:hypothetical protein
VITPVRRGKRRESTFAELESVPFTWYQQARASNIPVDGTILREKAKMITAQLNTENVTASNGWIARFKDRHGLVYEVLPKSSGNLPIKKLLIITPSFHLSFEVVPLGMDTAIPAFCR